MATPAAPSKSVPLTPLLVGLVVVIVLIAGIGYLNKPAPKPPADAPVSAEVKGYLRNLELSDVSMQATENFMQQQVVEVLGKIGNKGSRALASVEVYCLFYGVDGRELRREKVPIIGGPTARTPLQPGATRSFRLPFDSVPEGWNQAMPRMVIAQISFVQ